MDNLKYLQSIIHKGAFMPQSKLTLLHEWFEEVWNQGHLGTIDRLMAPGAVGHGLLDAEGNEIRGPEGFRALVTQFKQAFPDLRFEVHESVSEGDLIVVRCVVRGTHTGEGLTSGEGKALAATHRVVEISGMGMVRVQNGQIVEGWNNFDLPSLFAQIGA
jgi:predicted ester cyclase